MEDFESTWKVFGDFICVGIHSFIYLFLCLFLTSYSAMITQE